MSDWTYAAVAPKASKGFVTMAKDRTIKNTKGKIVMTTNFILRLPIAWRTQMGVISIATPMTVIMPDKNRFIRLSE